MIDTPRIRDLVRKGELEALEDAMEQPVLQLAAVPKLKAVAPVRN